MLSMILSVLVLATSVFSQNLASDHAFNANRTLSLGIILFPGFEPLDVYGPLQIFRTLSEHYKMTLSLIAAETGPISSIIPPHRPSPSQPPLDLSYILGSSTIATHTFANAPALNVILIPGGIGTMVLEQANNTAIETFVAARAPAADYVLSVCTGAVILARAGLLRDKRATTNKALWTWVTDERHGESVKWVPSARWTEDGKIWTSSGVAAGMDMTYAFLRHLYGTEKLDAGLNGIEYAPHQDASWDPFSVVHKVPGASQNGSLESCVRPVGYYS